MFQLLNTAAKFLELEALTLKLRLKLFALCGQLISLSFELVVAVLQECSETLTLAVNRGNRRTLDIALHAKVLLERHCDSRLFHFLAHFKEFN